MPTRPWPQRRRSVGLGPDHIVLDGDTARPPPKGHSPQFPVCVVAKRLDGSRYHLVYGDRLRRSAQATLC